MIKFYKIFFMLVSLSVAVGFSGCNEEGSSVLGGESGTLSLSLTDAPLVDEDNVTGVFISVAGIEYHTQEGWKRMEDFNTSVNPVNLLDWQEGSTIFLGDFQLPAGKYTQMRFLLDATEEDSSPKSSAGCYIEFDGDRNETLFVPSGTQSGYKAIGNYEVPVNGSVNITADFDVRKSVVAAGGRGQNTHYMLKPVIRLVVTNEAGKIMGTVNELNSSKTYGIYAYETSESMQPIAPDLAEAVTSTMIREDGSYTIAFLAEGTYDLAIVEYGTNEEIALFSWLSDIEVISGEITANIDMTW